ncbi:hypothetical protein JXR93_09240 [bacterium]|nr:hypothetical protein [bacterium]
MRCFDIDEILLKFPDLSEEEMRHINSCEACKAIYDKSQKLYNKMNSSIENVDLTDLNSAILKKASEKLIQLGVKPEYQNLDNLFQKNITKTDEISEKKNNLLSFRKRAKIVHYLTIAAILIIGVNLGIHFFAPSIKDLFSTSSNALSGNFEVLKNSNSSFSETKSLNDFETERVADLVLDEIKDEKSISTGEGSINLENNIKTNAKLDYSEKEESKKSKMDSRKGFKEDKIESNTKVSKTTKRALNKKSEEEYNEFNKNSNFLKKDHYNSKKSASSVIMKNAGSEQTVGYGAQTESIAENADFDGGHTTQNVIQKKQKNRDLNQINDDSFDIVKDSLNDGEILNKSTQSKMESEELQIGSLRGDKSKNEISTASSENKAEVKSASKNIDETIINDFQNKKYEKIVSLLEHKNDLKDIEKKYLIISLLKLKKCDNIKKIENFQKYLENKEIEEFNSICKITK